MQLADLLTLEADAAADTRVGCQQPQHRHRTDGLPRPRLPHQRENLATADREADAAHRGHGLGTDLKIHAEIADLEHHVGVVDRSNRSGGVRSDSHRPKVPCFRRPLPSAVFRSYSAK